MTLVPGANVARPPAPPYRGEGQHALWHFSEDPGIARFAPHVAATSERAEPLVWAADTRHAPLFWFPRDCPRATAWLTPETTGADRDLFFGHTEATRIHVIEGEWLERMRSARLYRYLLPPETFGPDRAVGGYWVSRETVEPLAVEACGDLLALHAEAGIELRVTPSLWPWWAAVIRSTLEFSGSRLRNCTVPEPNWVRPA
jgi:hypothetical protein